MMPSEAQIGIVVSEFNAEITQELLKGCLETLASHQVSQAKIYIVKVPGAVEIALACAKLAKLNCYDAIIALGAVIFGETDHYYYVCDAVTLGCNEVMLKYEVPILMGVLTVMDRQHALERIGGASGHKGKEAAEAALLVLAAHWKIKKDHGECKPC